MGECCVLKEQSVEHCQFSNRFDIKNGILGLERDIIFKLVKKMVWDDEKKTRHLMGMSGDIIWWIYHPNFKYSRNRCLKDIILNDFKDECLTDESIIRFTVKNPEKRRSVILKPLMKDFTMECTIKVLFGGTRYMCLGVVSPSQMKGNDIDFLMDLNCGASLWFNVISGRIKCGKAWSRQIKGGGVSEGSTLSLLIDFETKNKKSSVHFLNNEKMIEHVIVNLPIVGVHIGLCMDIQQVRFLSFSKIKALPPLIKCVAYNFDGGFDNFTLDLEDENNREIVNSEKYFVRKKKVYGIDV